MLQRGENTSPSPREGGKHIRAFAKHTDGCEVETQTYSLGLYSTVWTRCDKQGTGHTVSQWQKVSREAVCAVVQASRGRQGPDEETPGAFLKQKS